MAEQFKVLSVNKKARHNYSVLDNIECGIELKGTEVKSLKTGQFSFGDAYAKIDKGEVWLVSFHISPYDHGNIHNHDPDRMRKLLLHAGEIEKLRRKVMEKGLTLVPLRLYLKGGLVKLEIGVCKGKKQYDKRQDIKNRDVKREHERDYRLK